MADKPIHGEEPQIVDKGKGKAIDQPHDTSMDEDDEEEESSEDEEHPEMVRTLSFLSASRW